jgi:hypothetical protein
MAGFRFPAGVRDFSLLHSFQTGSEAQPSSYPMGTGGGLSLVKQLRREANNVSEEYIASIFRVEE